MGARGARWPIGEEKNIGGISQIGFADTSVTYVSKIGHNPGVLLPFQRASSGIPMMFVIGTLGISVDFWWNSNDVNETMVDF